MVVWTSIGAAFLFIEMHGAGPELAWWDALKTRFSPQAEVSCCAQKCVPIVRSKRMTLRSRSIPYWTRFPSSGIGSLTASERRQLDRERERLLKKSE